MPIDAEQSRLLKELGASVRRERVARKLTQERLAELVAVNPRTIQKIEAGGLNILVTTLARLQGALGCEWEALMPKAVVPPSRRK